MSLIFSRQCEYGLQAVLVLATKKSIGWTSISEITERLQVSEHFLAKILQDLSRRKILISRKGPQGGFKLARPSNQITLFEIISLIDGTDFLEQCILGFSDCSAENPCPVHDSWSLIRDNVKKMLLKNSIAHLVKMTKKFAPLD